MPVLTINAGSSSIRFSFHRLGEPPTKLLEGKLERIGLDGTSLSVSDDGRGTGAPLRLAVDAADHRTAAAFLMDWLEANPLFRERERSRPSRGARHEALEPGARDALAVG